MVTLSITLNAIRCIILDLQLLQVRAIDNDRAPFEVIFSAQIKKNDKEKTCLLSHVIIFSKKLYLWHMKRKFFRALLRSVL
jgi:hypothetical protein